MAASSFTNFDLDIREDLVEAHNMAWERIAGAGTWLTSARRIAVVEEIRKVLRSALCV